MRIREASVKIEYWRLLVQKQAQTGNSSVSYVFYSEVRKQTLIGFKAISMAEKYSKEYCVLTLSNLST